MKFLYNWDKNKAAEYYDNVIRLIPDITSSKIGIRAYAEILHMVPNKKMLQDWISLLSSIDNNFNRQAYGELLVLYRFIYHDDEWGKVQLQEVLSVLQVQKVYAHLKLILLPYQFDSLLFL